MTGAFDYNRHYRHWHDGSDGHFEKMVAGWCAVLEVLLPKERALRIVDVGCGTGFAVAAARRLGCIDVIGIDTDVGQVAEAQRRGIPVRHVAPTGSDEFFSENDGSFDVVFLFDVLEHIPVGEQVSFMNCIHRIMKPGGYLFCQVPNASSVVACMYRYIDWTHHCSFTEYSLDFILHNTGFSNIDIGETPDIWRPRFWQVKAFIMRRLRGVMRFVFRLMIAGELGWKVARAVPLSPNILARCRKPF